MDDLLTLVDANLKMDIIQQKLDKPDEKPFQFLKNIDEKLDVKYITHIQRIIEEYVKDRTPKTLYFYTTRNDGFLFHNVVQDDSKSPDEIKQMIEEESGTIKKVVAISDQIMTIDDKPFKKIKILGKNYKLLKI